MIADNFIDDMDKEIICPYVKHLYREIKSEK